MPQSIWAFPPGSSEKMVLPLIVQFSPLLMWMPSMLTGPRHDPNRLSMLFEIVLPLSYPRIRMPACPGGSLTPWMMLLAIVLFCPPRVGSRHRA